MGRWSNGWMMLMALLLACNGETVDDDSGDDDDATGGLEITAVLSEIVPTVVTVTFETDGTQSAEVVALGNNGVELRRAVDMTGGAPYSGVALGLKAATDYEVWIELGDGTKSNTEVVSTGAVPTALPSTSVIVADGATIPGGYLVTSVFAPEPAAVVIDGDGDYVWWSIPDAGEDKVSRCVPAQDGDAFLFWYVNLQDGPGGPLGDGNVFTRMAFDGTTLDALTMESGHHDFVELPDGTISFLDYETQETADGEKIGDNIVEISPDGTRTTVWSVWDAFEYDPDAQQIPGVGWSHGNALDYVEAEDAYYLSFLGFNSIVKIDRASSELQWIFGGNDSNFDADGETLFFIHQHQFQRIGDSLLVFDNGNPEINASKAVEYALDVGAGTAELTWSYAPDPDVYSFSLGDVSRLDNGNTLITFSTAGQVQEVTPAGDVVWELSMGLGGALGYVTYVEQL
ncbi:MAG: aryl-sulfate sulfotransferase [Myxococcota bacterium]|nr:aryl-sulfate sulfotransferase [Myxococcota bacterium]